MKNSLNLLFILVFSLVLQSCIGAKPSTNRKSSANTVKTAATATTPTFAADETLYWFTSTKILGTITINLNSENVVYVRGQNVHNFLISTDPDAKVPYYQNNKNYCLVAKYDGYKQLRVRAVPVFTNNFSTKVVERMFRIDIPNKAENQAACPGIISNVAATDAAYSLKDICPSCLGATMLTSAELTFFSGVNAPLAQVPLTKLSLSALKVKVDLQSNSSDGSNLCSNSSCEAKGFDCCIEGQCVRDGTEKALGYLEDDYEQAVIDRTANPLSFLNYPHIFNICSNISHNPPPVTPTTPPKTPAAEAQERVDEYMKHWKCINETVVTPACTALGSKKYLAEQCGCPTGLTDDQRAIKCPEWGVRPIYKSTTVADSNIIDFYCYTPAPENPIGPITNLNVNVSSRSAPHRFFGKRNDVADTMKSYDDPTKANAKVEQEGEPFYYLDEGNKAAPQNGEYNINSILGSMHVNISQTQPAKMVGVELGKTYIVSATSGYFTPCPQCAKDSWFATFTAHPATTNGLGLRAVGFTTSRDTYGANTTLGNYEDTKFGRACYVPVTMIPFSHKKTTTNEETQRANRLQTQAAFYINGYQRDWYGFNKGALIGSFDGVTWFAVGSGRRVTATSTKMFLAINAAFSDLATRTDTVVNIIPDGSSSTAPDYDYDPTLAITDPKQSSAGSCQQYHQCSTDSECVSQLGWEYTCADVSQLKTHWPIYNSDGQEILNQEKTGTIFEILAGTTTPGNSPKRCVYRGAGAPCVRDFTTLNGQVNQKALTCAPNFYCAALATNRFNSELARSPNEMNDILFGMDANILGRPLNYVTASRLLPAQVISNIQYNGGTDTLGLSTAQVADMGICRPGKSLSPTASVAHANPDNARRTDYINQIASCDSTAVGSSRTVSCPAFGDDLNYLPYNNVFPSPTAYKKQQNMCGAEARNTVAPYASAFANIEKGSLGVVGNIIQPTFAADACFRRAGSICHTDLDCGPNKMHEEIVSSMALSYFGGTEAEQNYWKESLICGQGTPVPALGGANYKTFKLSENRCCREIGKDFTMFTEGPATIVPENMSTNVNLVTDRLASNDPKAAGRYSRYEISKTGAAFSTAIPEVRATVEPASNQWKVINETGSLTCCGGGWVRKFADGTHDWKVKNRLNLDTGNFSCLNYRSTLASPNYANFPIDRIHQDTYQREFESFCKAPGQGGCMQIPFKDLDTAYGIKPPTRYLPSINGTPGTHALIDTTPVGDITTGAYSFNLNTDVPYLPFVYYFTQSPPYDLYIYENGQKRSLPFFIDKATDHGVSLYLPAYVQPEQFEDTATMNALGNTISIRYVIKTTKAVVIRDITNTKVDNVSPTFMCDAVANHSGAGQPVSQLGKGTGEGWCISKNNKTQNRYVLHIKADHSASIDWETASVLIKFRPLETVLDTNIARTVAEPGNRYYYLSKLGRLELLGIPQITYEPIYCNNNQNNIVPGIFTDSMTVGVPSSPDGYTTQRARFTAKANTYTTFDPINDYIEDGSVATESANIGNFTKKFTYQDKVAHAAVFSSKDFTCCTPLGNETSSAAKCCSGTASTVNNKLTCKLPSGTDLHVYFNKFVSSEGVGEDLLTVNGTDEEIDFNAFTGEPKLRDSTFTKIANLGATHCQSGIVKTGGAFGFFPPEPYSGYETLDGEEIVYPLSIVDSIIDSQEDDDGIGKFPFDNGFRWDHHYYCK